MPEKRFFKKPVFEERESPLTLAFETPTGYAFLSTFVILSLVYIIKTVAIYLLDGGISWKEDWSVVEIGFKGLPQVAVIWIVHHVILIIFVYPLTKEFYNYKKTLYFLSWVLHIGNVLHTGYVSVNSSLGLATRAVLAFETIRIWMKTISFMREIPNLMIEEEDNNNEYDHKKLDKQPSNVPVTSLSQFVYFLFCPTPIYAPEYPRTKTIHWGRVFLLNYINFVIVICGLRLVQAVRMPETFGKEPIKLTVLIEKASIYAIWYTILSVTAMAIFWQHCWQNIWAELMRFADRRFYSDYYSCHETATYFRKWNHIIQGWLYRYFYTPMVPWSGTFVAQMFLLFFSGLVHDYALFIVVGLLLPLHAISFVIVVLLARFAPKENPSFWHFMNGPMASNFIQGFGHFFMLLEFYSRTTCHKEDMSIFVPQFPSCLLVDYDS